MEPKLTFNEFYQSNKFAVNAVIGVGVFALLAYGALAVFKAIGKNREGAVAPEVSNEGLGVQPAPQQNVAATITDTKATSLANKLHRAMRDCGTDEEAISEAFAEMKNDADVTLVVQKFGVRPFLDTFYCSGEPTGVDKWVGNYDDADLATWLSAEIDCDEAGTMCSKMRSAGYDV